MATFPKTTSTVYEFAMYMVQGLTDHAILYPSVTLEVKAPLAAALDSFVAAIGAQGQAKAAAKNATAAKDAAQSALEKQLHKVLYLAEHDCADEPGNLEYIGWSGRKEPSPLQKPVQPSQLYPTYEGPGTLSLKWNKAQSGGPVSSFRIERSDQPAGGGLPGPWTIIYNTFETNITLPNQPRGIEMQYRVTATNPAGDSMPSNIATVVL